MSEIEMSLSFPLDSDGFLRRACPACNREFKWSPSSAEEQAPSGPASYYCPYCGAVATSDQWFTLEQVAYIQNEVILGVLGPSLTELAESLRDIERASGGLISASLEVPEPDRAPPIFELNDMRLVEFACHPQEPIKVADDWTGSVHCLVCGQETDASIL